MMAHNKMVITRGLAQSLESEQQKYSGSKTRDLSFLKVSQGYGFLKLSHIDYK